MSRRVGIVGGGWAGLAAGIEAVARGHQVTLFEMAPTFGGRARAIATEGSVLDNGQHILIGAYTETLRLMRTVGVDATACLLRLPLRLVDPDGNGLRLGPGPPALAFALAVWRQRSWRRAERLTLLAAATRWAASGYRCDPRWTVARLTERLPARVRLELIDPLCVAALNTPAAEASAQVFLRVIQDALFSGPGSADLLLPRTDLSRLFPTAAADWLTRAGATLRLSCRVVELARSATGGWRLCCSRGAGAPEAVDFDHLVLACAAKESARLVQAFAPAWSHVAAALRYEPIVTVYLQTDAARLREPMLALPESGDSPAQFVFDRGQLGGPAGLLAFVASGAADWVARGRPATEAAVARQARSLLGDGIRLGAPVTVTEKRATFRCTPQLARPAMRIDAGLCAAGDHVDGPYPATLEGAVRSGIAAASAVDGGESVDATAGQSTIAGRPAATKRSTCPAR